MYRKFLSVLFIFISILTVNAKDYPHLDYNLSSRDKESIAKIQAKMQHIRETEHRPTVGLVLSGGGAKGAAHIGVLKYLEEQHIPIDIITGASMGTLMGTLYCVGYSPEEMEHMINIADWDALIQDVIPSNYYTVEHREYKASVILDMPFYRGKDGEKVKLGMPSSLVPGMNVESYFASVLAGYTGTEIDFADLDIPLGCIATDIKNAVPRTFLNGNLVTAARSSMSIPAMFTPKKVGESTLVDGGLIDNFPATLARDMGADIVIGVDLSSSLNSKDIEDLGSIIGAMIDLAETPRHKVNNENCDFIIYPDVVKDFGMLSFDRKSIKEIISRGYSSAEACGTDLAKCLEDKGLQTSDHYYKERRHAVDVHNKWVNISSWELSGIQNDFDRKYILSLVESLLNSHIADKEKLDDIVARIYAKGAFDSVTWELIGAEEPYGLRINCTPGKKHQIGMGVRFDTEEVATIDLHFGYNYHKLAGNKLNFFGRISANPQIKLSYSLDLPKMPTLNAEAKVRWASSNVLRYGSTDNQFRNFSYFNTNAKIFISYFEAKKCTFQVGAAYDYYQLLNRFEQALDPSICNGINLSMNNWKVYGRINLNTLDDINNPRKGVLFNVGYECDIRPRLLHIASLKLMTPINFKSKRFTLTPTLVARAILGQTYENTPCFHLNLIGGEVEGRYIDNQMAFTGLQVSPMGNLMAMAKLDARVMVYENVYVSARANYAACIKDVQSIKTRPADWHHDVLGCGLEGAFITRYGSVKALFSYNTLTKKVGFYASFGKCF